MQGDIEKCLQQQVPTMRDRSKPGGLTNGQHSFFSAIVVPLISAWVLAFPFHQELLQRLDSNASGWIAVQIQDKTIQGQLTDSCTIQEPRSLNGLQSISSAIQEPWSLNGLQSDSSAIQQPSSLKGLDGFYCDSGTIQEPCSLNGCKNDKGHCLMSGVRRDPFHESLSALADQKMKRMREFVEGFEGTPDSFNALSNFAAPHNFVTPSNYPGSSTFPVPSSFYTGSAFGPSSTFAVPSSFTSQHSALLERINKCRKMTGQQD